MTSLNAPFGARCFLTTDEHTTYAIPVTPS